jgi:predicted small metal-binding protein
VLSREEDQMAKLINCQCGRKIRGESDDEVITQAEQHIAESHPDLVGQVTREQLFEWIEED